MNLLLLLSALLSALSGVGQAVRGVREPQAVCASVARAPAAVAHRRSIARRPLQALARPGETVVAPLAMLALEPAEPIFAGRRRE